MKSYYKIEANNTEVASYARKLVSPSKVAEAEATARRYVSGRKNARMAKAKGE